MKKTVAALVVGTVLSGCTQTVSEMKASSADSKRTYHLAANYQTVYRLMVTQARDCWQTSGIGVDQRVDADIFPDIETASVTLNSTHGPYGQMTHARVELAKASTGTDMAVWTQYGGSRFDFVDWANGGKSCP